jgi:3D (Asp-Asp-Asp) domain-containing protein
LRTLTLRHLTLTFLAVTGLCVFTSCGTTAPRRTAPRPLPNYEPPLARANLQTVRTTAYTHSEADHLIYGRRNALGGTLASATVPGQRRSAVKAPRKTKSRRAGISSEPESLIMSYMSREKRIAAAKKADKKRDKKNAKADKRHAKALAKAKGKPARATLPEPPRIGSAAADWSRWPAGTVFKVLSTGQMYRVDDYGWALAGTNTIDLYMPSQKAMNTWGVRHVPIQVIKWGDPQQSLAVLRGRQSYRHVRRMVLALEGQHETAAALR